MNNYSWSRFTALGAVLLLLEGCWAGMLNSDGPSENPTPSRAASTLRPRTSPLSVGDTFPSFEAPDQLGRLVSSNELSSGKGSALLIVPPSAEGAARPAYEWAARNGNLLAQRGVELVLLIPESPEEGARIAADQGLRLGLLSDHGSRIAAALGTTSGGSGRPARPHLYFLGPDGRIHYSVSGTGDVAQLLLAAESLPGARRQSAIPLFN